MFEAREIDFHNLGEILKVKTSVAQEKFVAPNSVTVAQFHYEPSGWMRALYDGDTAVGLIAMINPKIPSPSFEDGDPDDGGFIWRLLIGEAFQRHGYGRQALKIAMDVNRDWGFQKLYCSAVPGDMSPIPFYEKCGFRQTGKLLGTEIELLADL